MKKSGTIALTLGVSALVTSGCYTAVNSPWIPSWGVTRAISKQVTVPNSIVHKMPVSVFSPREDTGRCVRAVRRKALEVAVDRF